MSETARPSKSLYQFIEQIRSILLTKDAIWKFSVTFLVMAALFAVISRTVVDSDLWGHLRFGLDNLQSGSIAQIDPYSYLSLGQRWINHEWLAEVFFGLAWLAAGSMGLILLKTTVGVITLGLIYWYLVRSGVSPIRAGVLVILGWLGILTAIATIRPHMFTLLFSAITFIIIAQADKRKYRWLWAAPPVFLLWINFHGGVLAGLGFLGIWTVIHLILHRQEWLKILPPVLLTSLAVLINPYGIDLVTFLFRTATIPRPEIVEWQPLKPVSLLGSIYLSLLIITILGLVYSKQKKSIPIVVLLGVAALLPFVAFRHLPLFALAALVLGGEYINDAWSRATPSQVTSPKRPRWIILLSVISGFVLLIWGYSNLQQIRIPNEPEPFFPDRSVSIIKQSQVGGNLAVEFNWGEYAIWHLGPEVQVSMDGRRETVYSDEIYKKNQAFIYGTGVWDAVLDEYDSHMALVFQSKAAYNLLSMKEGWELIYEDASSALFAESDWTGFNALEQAAVNFRDRPDDVSFP
jgi:hypothetical protein